MDVTDFADRPGTALVSGGTGGIGAAICAMLHARGSKVAFTYRSNHERAAELQAEMAPTTFGLSVELGDSDAVAGFVAGIVERVGPIHTLVHAAGPEVRQTHLSKVTPDQYREALENEAAAFFTVVHHVLPHLREANGSVVAVTTAATRRYPVRDGLSSSTKAAIESTVKGLAAEEGRFGVRANCVGPGMLTDGMAERLIASGELDDKALDVTRGNIPLRRFGRATDIAEAVCFLASDRANFITGQCLDVDGGYTI